MAAERYAERVLANRWLVILVAPILVAPPPSACSCWNSPPTTAFSLMTTIRSFWRWKTWKTPTARTRMSSS